MSRRYFFPPSLACTVQAILLTVTFACFLNEIPKYHATAFLLPTNNAKRRVRNRVRRDDEMTSLLASSNEREGFVPVCRDVTGQKSEHELHYKIVRPMNLSSQKAAPLVVLHGGPSVPSDYLYPLSASMEPYRSIIFYDQLGCGRSDEPSDPGSYSIDLAISDLEVLLKKLGVRRFHLYGQSFGGILAFEYLKKMAEADRDGDIPKCLCVVLSSAPTDVHMVEKEANKITADLLEEDDDASTLAERFRRKSQCRTPVRPAPLKDSYDGAGTVWRGTTAIPGYVASPPCDGAERMPSALVMRGEFDFVTSDCVAGWKSVFNHKFVREKTLKDCSHHGLLENGSVYGEIVDSFCSEYD